MERRKKENGLTKNKDKWNEDRRKTGIRKGKMD
jgi:hypothetical protein